MSRRIDTSIASVQFQVDARQASASMQALQDMANRLNKDIDSVNRNIANLGNNVPKDNPQLLAYQQQLRGLNSDLKDVMRAQKDFMRGAKAADQLWKAASEGTIESLSFRSIRTGINGLKKRQEGLRPGDAQDMKDYRIIKQVIEEADRVVKAAGNDVQNVVQTIREGGKVSEQTMRQTISTLKELKGSVDETDADFRTWGSDLDFMEAKMQEFNEAQRRAKGEIVDANDARREMNKLTEEGAAAAKREAEEADRLVASLKQESEELVRKRGEIKQNIEDTQKQIDENHKLIEEKHRQLAANEETFQAEQQSRRESVDGLKQQAEAERKLANEKSDAAETHRRAAELQKQTTEQLTGKVAELQGKLEALQQQDQQNVQTTNNLTEAQRLYNEAVERRNLKEQELKEIQERSYNDDPEVKRLNEEIAKLEELIAVTDKYKKQFIKMSDKKFEEGYMGDDAEVKKHFRTGLDPTKYIYGAEDYLVSAYRDRFYANFHKLGIRKPGDDGYEKDAAAADRVAKGIVENAQEALRRAILHEIEDGTLSSASMEEMVKNFRRNMYEAAREAGEGNLKDDPEYNTYKYIIAQMEKYLEVAKKVEEERAKIAGGGEFLEMARDKDDINAPREGLFRQREKREFQESTGWGDFKRRQEEDEGSKSQEVTQAKNDEKEAERQLNEEKAKSNQQTEEELRLKGELETAQNKLAESKKRENEEQQESIRLQGEAAEQDRIAAKAESDLAQAESTLVEKQAEVSRQQDETLAEIGKMGEEYEGLKTKMEGYEQQLKENGKAYADNAQQQVEAEAEKAQAQQLTIKRMEEMIAALRKQYEEEATTAEQRTKIKDEIDRIDAALRKAKGGFESADEVLARFTEHMNAGKTASEGMAQTLDEKLNAATSVYDANIKNAAEEVDRYETQIKEATEELAKMEQELAELEQKHANSSWFRKHTGAYRHEAWRIEHLRDEIGEPETLDDGTPYMSGKKGDIEWFKQGKQSAQQWLDHYKQLKAEELGLTESEVQAEEKKADAKRLTNEQMQEGIKLLEEEYAKTDHTTEEGIKKRQQLREAIDQMNQELKESTGEWMSVADAMKLAGEAEKNTFLGNDGMGFTASAQDIQKATQALERQRDVILQTIKVKRDSGKATDAEEKELADLTKKLRDLKFEQDNFNMSQAKMQELMRTPTNAVSLDELRAAIKRADGELKRMEGSLGKNSKQYQEFAAQVKNAKNQMKEMEGQAKASATAWEKAWSRLKTYVVMYMGFNAVWQKVMGTADDILELSDKMGEVRKTTGFTADEVGRLSDNLAKLDTRTSLTGLMEFSSLAGSIGMKTQEDVQGFTEAANMLAVSLPEMGNEASRTLMKIADATGDLEKNGGNVRETLERVGSTIIALRANSAAAAGPITDFVSRVGAVGAQAGISIDQIAALGATVDALGGRVEMSATALSRMIPAIKNNTFEVAKAIGMTEKELKDMTGMEQMVAIFHKLHDSVKGFDTSTEEGMNAMADSVEKALGRSTSMQEVMKELNQQGARAGIVFGLLSQNVDKLEEQLDTASDAYQKNTALMSEYSKMNDTAAAKWARLRNQLEEFFMSADSTSWLSDTIDWLRKLVDLITEEGPIGRFFRWTLVYLALWKAKWAETIGTALISLGKYLLATQASTAATTADTAAKTSNAAATEATAVANEHAAVASGKFNKTMKANVIAAVATAVVALGWSLYDYAKKAKKAAEQSDILADVEKKAMEASIDERVQLEKLYRVTQDQTASMEERRKALKDMVGDAKYQEYYSKLSTESELASTAASAYKELSEQILATARARALDAEAEELQRKRIKLENQKSERENWEDENRGKYRAGKQEYNRQQGYAGRVTGGVTAGFQESQIAQQGAVVMKPAIIDEFENSVKERNRIDAEIGQIDKDLEKLKEQVKKLNIKPSSGGDGGNGGGGGGSNNPYGDYNMVTSAYSQWDANDLVARRKEMLERVKALANGADVQKVLSEDAKFITEATRKNIKTTEQAIEWYNTERLKIQDALHAKHLTNTGDWMDPKKGGKKASKMVQDEMKYYLDELDAYYTERKAKIQEARNDEAISEAEAWNRDIKNEAEWYRRRAELQQLYAKESEKVAQDEQDAIFNILSERTEDSIDYIKKDIDHTVKFIEKVGKEKGKPAMDRIIGDIDLGIEKAFLKQRNTLGKHLKAIEDIVNKERPFNGIAKNLQDNLGKMGILTADMAEGADSAAEELKRITFLLGESENAYTMTVEKLLEDMRQNGFKEWADVVSKDPSMQQGLLAMLRQTFDAVQDAIKKESSIIKKQVENMMLDITEQVQADTTRLQILQNSVSRANSLISAGPASERVADKLAMKQMQMQITLQETRIRMLKKAGADRVALLQQEAELRRKDGKLEEAKQMMMDAENVKKSVGLTLTKEQVELDKQRISLAEKLEESQNRLYNELKEWGDLLYSSVRDLMEAEQAGNKEYYNELAKLNLTGKGGPGAGLYVVIDDEGTEDAKAHYEYLDEREALERQHEIELENARAEAWKKVWDDLNNKMSEQITDWINASLQNMSVDANTNALDVNTAALGGLSAQLAQGITVKNEDGVSAGANATGTAAGTAGEQSVLFREGVTPGESWMLTEDQMAAEQAQLDQRVQMQKDAAEKVRIANESAFHSAAKTEGDTGKQMQKSSQSTFAKMTLAANMYGVAYQAMSNDNLSATQKFEMMALQAVGNYAIGALTTEMATASAKAATDSPGVLGKLWKELGWAATPVFAIFTGLLGGLMGLASSKIGKAKSQIAQATGASSASAGKLTTGMLAYAEGNVNEFTDPGTLTPGRSYNVDAADGKTYRAKYTGSNPKTHITNGPEFHLVGEAGREAIIDAHTTRNIQMNEPEIWRKIQVLYNGGSLRRSTLRKGVKAFADGNIDDFTMPDGVGMMADSMFSPEMIQGFQQSLDRNSELLERALKNGIVARNIWYGPEGIPNMYNKMQKEAERRGEKYL